MKRKITISLEEDVAEKLRLQSIEKYGNARSFSLYIEDLANGAATVEPEAAACSILGARTPHSLGSEEDFKKSVEEFKDQIVRLKFNSYRGGEARLTSGYADFSGKTHHIDVFEYFIIKEAFEVWLNQINEHICWNCSGCLIAPPKYPDAGKNFVNLALTDPYYR